MKAILGLLVLIVLAVYLAYQFGGVGSFDPEKQATEFNATVKPGMTWQQVVEKFPPKKMAVYGRDETGSLFRANEEKFILANFEKFVKAPGFPDGFDFCYTFSGEHAYVVTFDSAGNAQGISKARTLGDLMKIGVSTN